METTIEVRLSGALTSTGAAQVAVLRLNQTLMCGEPVHWLRSSQNNTKHNKMTVKAGIWTSRLNKE